MNNAAVEKEKNGLEYPVCNLCGADDTSIVYDTVPAGSEGGSGRQFSTTSGYLGAERVVRCNKCGLIYINPRQNHEMILDSYAGSVEENYVAEYEGRYATFAAGVRYLERWMPQKGKLLDVGAAAGFFVKAAKDMGWQAQGVEPCRWLGKYARDKFGLDVRDGTLLDAKYPAASFDVVTMWDVLEHVADPKKDLQEAHRVLKKGGLILINYPEITSWAAKLAGQKWWFLLSMHLYYFTPKTLERMLKDVGFEKVHIKPHSQKLSFGYLLFRLEPYCGWAAKLGQKIVGALGLSKLQIPYYAAQTAFVARKV